MNVVVNILTDTLCVLLEDTARKHTLACCPAVLPVAADVLADP